jgi:hypothetical protein
LDKLPIINLNIKDLSKSKIHDQIVNLVSVILDKKNKIVNLKTPTERTAIERQIQATDNQIDQLVYQLYGLTEEEIKIVEGDK